MCPGPQKERQNIAEKASALQNLVFPNDSDGKESIHNAADPGLIPGSGWFPGEGNGNTLQYSCLENSMNRGAWCTTVHGGQEESYMTEATNTFTFTLSLILDGRWPTCIHMHISSYKCDVLLKTCGCSKLCSDFIPSFLHAFIKSKERVSNGLAPLTEEFQKFKWCQVYIITIWWLK